MGGGEASGNGGGSGHGNGNAVLGAEINQRITAWSGQRAGKQCCQQSTRHLLSQVPSGLVNLGQ